MPDKISTQFRDGPVVLISKMINFTFPLAYAFLTGYLREHGEDVRIMFRPPASEFGVFVKEIMDTKPVLVGFGSLYPELREISMLVGMLNDAGRRFPIVIGGQMVTPIPEFAVEITGADIGVLGEGEITLHRLVTALREGKDPAAIKGLLIRRGNKFISTGPGKFIEDLSGLPPIPYDLFPSDKWLNIGRWYAKNLPQPQWRFSDRVINVHGSRGCPFSCNFCYHHSKPRYRPVDVMMGEARRTLERFNGNMLYFSDETALISPQRTQKILEEIKRFPRRIEYSVSSRFDILDKIDDNLLAEMSRTGCRIMGLGIESGSDRILSVIGKKFSAQTVRRGLERLKKAGILPTVSIMVGQFTETVRDVEESIALVKESVRNDRNIQYTFTLATPFPGTELYNLIFEKGYLNDNREFYDLYFKSEGDFKHVVNLSDMTDGELATMFEKIWKTYEEEKTKAIRPIAKKVERLISVLSLKHEAISKKVFSRIRILDKLWQWLYEFVQLRLDNLRLGLRGISAGRR